VTDVRWGFVETIWGGIGNDDDDEAIL